MDAGEDQNTSSTNGNAQTGGNSRPSQIAHMSLYERQAVQVCLCLGTYITYKYIHVLIAYLLQEYMLTCPLYVQLVDPGSPGTSEAAKCCSVLPAADAAAAANPQPGCCATGNIPCTRM